MDPSPPPPPPVHFACRVMASGVGGASTARSVITVSGEDAVVYCPDYKLSKVLSFQFDSAHHEQTPLFDVYQETIEPLASTVVRGACAMSVVCGEDAMGKRVLTEGRPFWRTEGLIGMAADTLFRRLAKDVSLDDWQTSVRVSWYQIQDDVIVDVLRAAGMGPSEAAAAPSSGKTLVMRDHPKLGVTVPNLWEVEIRSAADVQALINSVHPDTSLPDPAAHSVWSFTVHQTPVVPFGSSPSRATTPTASSATSSPTPVVSALRVMVLANTTAPPADKPVGELAPWVKSLHRVLSKLERRSPAAPFHLSRVTLALRDTLCGRHHSSFIGLVSPSIDATPASTATLNVVGRIRSVVRAFEGIDSAAPVSTVGLRSVDGPSPVFPRRPVASPSPSPRRQPKTTGIAGDLLRPSTPSSPDRRSGGGGGSDNSFLHTVASAARAAAARAHAADPSTDTSPLPAGNLTDTFTHSLVNLTSAGGGGGGGGGATPSLSTPAPSTMNGRGAGGGSGGALMDDTVLSGGPAMRQSELWTSTIRSGAGLSDSAVSSVPEPSAADPMLRAEQIASRMAVLSARGDESARWFTALLTALETSRAEAAELKERVDVLQRETSDLVSERNALREALTAVTTTQVPVQTAEAVSATVKDLKRRLKAAEQEIKDYELYKDVMETAVCRMQDTMQETVDERESFRKALRAAHAATRREREDLLITQRRVSDLELELETRTKEASATDKTVQRALAQAKRQADRAARHQDDALAMFRDEAETEMKRLRAELALARTENEDLRRRFSDSVSRDAAESDRTVAELTATRDALSVSQMTNAALRKRTGGRPPALPSSSSSSSSRRGGGGGGEHESSGPSNTAAPDSSMDTDALFTLAHGVAQDVTELVTPRRGNGSSVGGGGGGGGISARAKPRRSPSSSRRPPAPPRHTTSRARSGGSSAAASRRAPGRSQTHRTSPNSSHGRAALIAGLKKEMGSRSRTYKP